MASRPHPLAGELKAPVQTTGVETRSKRTKISIMCAEEWISHKNQPGTHQTPRGLSLKLIDITEGMAQEEDTTRLDSSREWNVDGLESQREGEMNRGLPPLTEGMWERRQGIPKMKEDVSLRGRQL